MAVDRRNSYHAPSALLPALLFFLVLGTFLPSLRNGFVNLDDQSYVTDNPHVRQGLTRQSLKWIWGDTDSSNWHPLTWVSHMLDSQVFGVNPAGHHATSVLLHAVNAALLFLLLRKMTGALWHSFAVAALFGLHPSWISERKDVLSAFFWILTMWAYVRYARDVKSRISNFKLSYLLSLVFFVLGLLSKPMLVTLPFALLLLDYWPLRRWPQTPVKRLLLEKMPFLLLAAASCVVTFQMQQRDNSVTPADTLRLSARLANAVVSYARYLGMTAWPVDLCVMYPHPGYWPAETVAGAALLLAAVTGWVLWRKGSMPYLAVGWFWFLGTLVPAIGVVQVGRQALADRYTYIPSIGLWMAVVWAAARLMEHWRHREAIARAVLAGAIVTCVALTVHQIGYWQDTKTLFEHAINVTRRNWIATSSLADEFQHEGRVNDAVEMYQQTLKINPYHGDVWLKLGNIMLAQRRFDEAQADFQKAVELDPADIYAHRGLGSVFQDTGRFDEAIEQFNQVLRFKPDDSDSYSNLGNCYGMKGRPDDAIHCFEQAVKLKPKSAQNHRELGIGLANKARWDEAIDQFQQTLQLDPSDAPARQLLNSALRDKARTAH
jgi:tetratricopeptide (TPR) repeat protein